MDVLLLSRIQFALTTAFHYLFPPLSIGLGLLLALLAATLVRRSEVIQAAKCSASATPAPTAIHRSPFPIAGQPARPAGRAKNGSRKSEASVRRQAAIARGGAAVRRMSGAAQETARTAASSTR